MSKNGGAGGLEGNKGGGMGCGGEWSWSRNGVRKVKCVRGRRTALRVFAGSDWGCHSFAAEDDGCECGVAQSA